MPIPVPGSVAESLRRQTVHIQMGRVRAERTGRGPEGAPPIVRGHLRSAGSGLAVGNEQVITNAHVIRGGSLAVEAWDGSEVAASCLRRDARRDLALLSAPGLRAEPACLGDSDSLRAGTAVFAVGNPLGFVGAVSSGVVHSIGSLGGMSRGGMTWGGMTWIQADLRLAPGSSGGPLADFHGQVLGINTMVVSGGLALAVPSRAVQSFLMRAKTGRGLGITVRPVELERGKWGIMILEISTGSPAAAASLLPGDILLGADSRMFRSLDDLQFAIDSAPEAIMRLDFYRGGQSQLRHVAVRVAPERVPTAA